LEALEEALKAERAGAGRTVATEMGQVAKKLYNATSESKTKLEKGRKLDPNDPIIKSYESLSASFAGLADAASRGDGSALIAAAKQIQAEIKKLKGDISKVAAGCRNPSEQEKLYNMSTALENFGVQLKILAAVKAGSSKADMGNDSHLISTTKNMGATLEYLLVATTAAKLQSK